MPGRCRATKLDGTRCKRAAQADGTCFWHKLNREERVDLARRGGLASAKARRAEPEPPPTAIKEAAPTPVEPTRPKPTVNPYTTAHARATADFEMAQRRLIELYEAGRLSFEELPADVLARIEPRHRRSTT